MKVNWILRDNIQKKVFESIGMASMCWIPKPYKEVFDSTRAKEISEELVNFIIREIEEK